MLKYEAKLLIVYFYQKNIELKKYCNIFIM